MVIGIQYLHVWIEIREESNYFGHNRKFKFLTGQIAPRPGITYMENNCWTSSGETTPRTIKAGGT